MYDLISAICAGLFVLAVANIYFSLNVLINHEYEDDKWIYEKRRFNIGVCLVCIFIGIGCFTWVLWDAHLITKLTQYKIGLLGRAFAVAGTFHFFLTLTLGMKYKERVYIICGAIASATIMYLAKVLM